LEFGDEDTFAEKVLRLKEAVVIFDSNGGNLIAGLEIGRGIRLKGFDTFVPDNMLCASACALAWLGGKEKLAGPEARIAFHAAWKLEDGKKVETGPGNALVGAYLHSLGLSDEAILFITSAPPDGAEMLTFRKAEQLGIRVRELPSPPEPVRTVTKPAAPKPAVPEDPDTAYYDPSISTLNPQRAPPREPSGAKTAALPPATAPVSPRWRPEQPEMQPQVLNLASLDAASQVQRRLQERGFFTGLVDGVWGPKSRVALRDFKMFNGLGSDDEWDLKTQLALFDDRYRIASAGYVPPDPSQSTNGLFKAFSPPPGATLHPLNIRDALAIQGKLFEMGYYRKPGDGVWGLASRSALRDLKVANGLASDDVWDGSVETLLAGGRAVPASETPFGEWAITGTSCTDENNAGHLSVSATEIIAGGGICRIEQGLTRSRDTWSGIARCSRGGEEAKAQVALRIVGGRLFDQSTVGMVQNPRPPVFERCR
jgi:peptidoglycan hydrolase-like protein with peptidoglycan-binding domain